jgi:hypothetical protein
MEKRISPLLGREQPEIQVQERETMEPSCLITLQLMGFEEDEVA